MELSEYLRVLVRSWVTIVAFTLLGLAVAACALLLQPVTYVASADSYVSVSSVRDVNTASEGSAFSKSLAADLATIAVTPYVLDRVHDELKLKSPASALAAQVSAVVLSDGAVVRVSVTTGQPQLSAAIANAVVVELNDAAARLNPNAGNAASVARTTTVGRATVPTSPSTPVIPINLVIGALSGFALGVLIVLARQLLDPRLRTVQQIGRLTDAPVVGPLHLTSTVPADFGRHVDDEDLRQFRRLRGELMQTVVGDRVVVALSGITSGRSTIQAAAALGASFAAAGLPTLVIDADGQTELARSVYGEPHSDLTDVLAYGRPLSSVLVDSQIDRLSFLPGSRSNGQRDDLLNGPSMAELLRAATQRFPAVVINVRSIEDVSLPSTVAGAADGAVLACEIDIDASAALQRALSSLERGRVRLLASVAFQEWNPPARQIDASAVDSAAFAGA